MTTDLTRKVITDKNGVTTTRWVKPQAAVSGAPVTIPKITALSYEVPSLDRVSRVSLLGALYEVFSERGDYEEWDIDEVTSALKNQSDHTLRLITTYIQKDGEVNDTKVTDVVDLLITYSVRSPYLNELLSYYGDFPYGTAQEFREEAIEKLHKCAELPAMDDYSLADEETQAEIRRLLTSAAHHYEDYYDPDEVNIIIGEKMRQFIADNMDHIDRIDQLMEQRQTEDPDLINSIINSETSSISSGLL